jgi:hypothetical protein
MTTTIVFTSFKSMGIDRREFRKQTQVSSSRLNDVERIRS